MISIVIPAHNEASVIERCLHSLLADGELAARQVEIIVVCNGCSDNTAELAAAIDGVRAESISKASKIAALNHGDSVASGFPRIYLDADIEATGKDLLKTLEAFEEPGVLAAAPSLNIDTSGSSLAVKAFYAVWLKLPYFADNHMIGSGIYILSEAGRARFGEFPDIISDDGYVRSLYGPAERITVRGASFKVFAPRNFASLLKIKTRARFGNMQVVQRYPQAQLGGENDSGAFVKLALTRPWLIPAMLIYVYTQWQTKRNSLRKFREQDFGTWERDESAR